MVIADNGKSALDRLEEEPGIELVLMDVMMPVMDGYEATRKLRQMDEFKALPVISLTAKAMSDDKAKCLEAGANDYMTKPVDMDKLVENVKSLVIQRMKKNKIEELELELLLKAISSQYGHDFHDYAKASMLRRIKKHLSSAKLEKISDLIPLFLHDQEAFNLFVKDMSVVVTEMFRDPEFFQVLRRDVVPILKTYPFIKIWHAGCASGQESLFNGHSAG